jgi:hypothetical protein
MTTENGAVRSHHEMVLHRLNNKYDDVDDQLRDIMQRQQLGEEPDAQQFMKLLEKHSIVEQAMEAQFALRDKPQQTALNESR